MDTDGYFISLGRGSLHDWLRPEHKPNAPSMSAFTSGSPGRPVMCTGPSSWTSWHTWGPAPSTQRGNVARPVGCMMKRHRACSRQNGALMARWFFVVRPTTAGMVMTSYPTRVCRRTPIVTLWLIRPIAVSWPWGAGAAAWIAALGWGPADTYTPHLTVGADHPVQCGVADDGVNIEPLHLWGMQTACLLTCRWEDHLHHHRRCFSRWRRIWDVWPTAAVALLHATRRLFRQQQVHIDHAAGVAVFSQMPARVLLFYSHM